MDFAAGDAASGKQAFRVRQPGVYLARVEIRPQSDQPGGEQFAELDLVLK